MLTEEFEVTRIRPIRFDKVAGIADLGAAGAGLLVKLDAEGPGRSWYALLPSGTHDPVDLPGVDLNSLWQNPHGVRPAIHPG